MSFQWPCKKCGSIAECSCPSDESVIADLRARLAAVEKRAAELAEVAESEQDAHTETLVREQAAIRERDEARAQWDLDLLKHTTQIRMERDALAERVAALREALGYMAKEETGFDGRYECAYCRVLVTRASAALAGDDAKGNG